MSTWWLMLVALSWLQSSSGQLLQQQQYMGPPMRLVPGSMPSADELQVTSLSLPYELFGKATNQSGIEFNSANSYVIERRRFVEAHPTRCYASTLPNDPKQVEPQFVIITKQSELRLNATAPMELIMLAGFQPHQRTTIFIHGFTQSYPDTQWLRKSRALFELNSLIGHQNLIIMDWSVAARSPFSQAAANASPAGSFLASFIMKLLELGQDRMQLHLVGHSLGAHVAGFAGKRLRPRIGRITALDAAGPCFGKLFLNEPQDRIGPDDAHEVAVYHYDDDFLGLPGQHGQFDVYVNGGSQQPGCKGNAQAMVGAAMTMLFRLNRVLSESHSRSTEVSSKQLGESQCQQVAYECRDYQAFVAGECGHCDDYNNQCYLMSLDYQYQKQLKSQFGSRSAWPSKRLYVSTGPIEDLFCMLHYQILVKFEPTPELSVQAKRHKWRLQLELANDRQERLNLTITNQMAPNIFSYLLLTSPRPARFRSGQLLIQQLDGKTIRLQQQPVQFGNFQQQQSKASIFRVFAIDINFLSHISPQVRRTMSSRLCPTTWAPPEQANSLDEAHWSYFDECFAPPPSNLYG